MENKFNTIENLEEELGRIKEEIERKKKETGAEEPISPEKQREITSEAVKEHVEKYPAEKLGERYRMTEEEKKKHIGDLEPEEDDRKVSQLLEIAKEKGVVNAFEICKQISPHLADDFHRALVHYLNFELTDENIRPAKISNINLILIAAAVLTALLILFLMFR